MTETTPASTTPELVVAGRPGRRGGPDLPQERRLVTEIPGPLSNAIHARRTSAVAKGVSSTLPIYIEKAGGGVLVDVDGNSLIDLGAGIAVVNAGNANPAVVSAVQEQVAAFTHTCFMVTPYELYVAVAEKLNELTPGTHDKRSALFNSGAEALTGYSAAEALSSLEMRKLYPEGIAQMLIDRLRSDEFGGRGRLSATRVEVVTRSGERVPVNMTASILYEGDREVATVGIVTDLRDRVQLERKLSDAEVRLEESKRNAVLMAIAGNTAHELNQPLTSVLGFAELLKRKLKTDDESYKRVDTIFREAERMKEIVKKIGKITRYELKSYVGESQILDLERTSDETEEAAEKPGRLPGTKREAQDAEGNVQDHAEMDRKKKPG